MKVSLKTFVPAVAAGLVTLTSCNSVDDRARKYMYLLLNLIKLQAI